VVIVAFLFLTAPVAAHAIGRAGYRRGSPLWTGTTADELGEGARRNEGA
jgi:multicomponent Na+:H+ antiporter subunit G